LHQQKVLFTFRIMDRISKSQRSANMSAVHGKNTAPEIAVRKAAHRLGLCFRLHSRDLPGCPDLVFPKWNAALFVNGCFWHGHRGKPKERIEDRTLVMADVGCKAITQVKQAASGLLTRRLPAEKASELEEKLATGIWTHDYPIWASTAKLLGLSVSTDMPDDVLQLLTLYPQPVRTQSGGGGVEYLPVERRTQRQERLS
jgi:DNA mismatch endonuclease Vsr